VALDADPLVRRFMGGALHPAANREEVRRLIALGRPLPHALWAVEWRHRPGLIGLAGLDFLAEAGETQIGWRLTRSAWGQGIATEAGRAVLTHALGPMGLRVVVALIDPANAASWRVAEKIGMRQAAGLPHRGVEQRLYVSGGEVEG